MKNLLLKIITSTGLYDAATFGHWKISEYFKNSQVAIPESAPPLFNNFKNKITNN